MSDLLLTQLKATNLATSLAETEVRSLAAELADLSGLQGAIKTIVL